MINLFSTFTDPAARLECFYMITTMGIEPTNYWCDASHATLNIKLGYPVSNQTNCIPLHYLSMSSSLLPCRNTLHRLTLRLSFSLTSCSVTQVAEASNSNLPSLKSSGIQQCVFIWCPYLQRSGLISGLLAIPS